MKYKNLTVLFKNDPDSDDWVDGGTHRLEFENAAILITGDHMVITTEDKNGELSEIFKLKTIHSYRGKK